MFKQTTLFCLKRYILNITIMYVKCLYKQNMSFSKPMENDNTFHVLNRPVCRCVYEKYSVQIILLYFSKVLFSRSSFLYKKPDSGSWYNIRLYSINVNLYLIGEIFFWKNNKINLNLKEFLKIFLTGKLIPPKPFLLSELIPHAF